MADIHHEMADTYQTQIIIWLAHKKCLAQEEMVDIQKCLKHKITDKNRMVDTKNEWLA
jgi:adenine C2-methylase RlmN of 23S rRNA A2503 and tRNA A37